MDSSSLIKSPVTAELEAFEKLFDATLASDNVLLNSATDYIRRRNGKRMRPILVLLLGKLLGNVCDATLHAAVSLELLHTASLVHDDVVDESAERRGQLSVNAAFSNKVAVLVGDFLLANSLVHASQTFNHAIIGTVSVLGRELADGELLQLSNVSSDTFSEEVYFKVIRKKTAALFAACSKVAAISVGASEELTEQARLFGERIGICFQIRDDIFDYFNSPEIGKPTGNDMAEGKLTLPLLYVLNTHPEEWAVELALKVRNGNATEEEIKRLVEFTIQNGGIEYAEEVMLKYRSQALDWVNSFEGVPEVKQALTAFVNYVTERKK